jgi:HD domain
MQERNVMNANSISAQPAPTSAPQGGRRRLILPHPIADLGRAQPELELALMAQLGPDCVFMMGDNPALPKMPEQPRLMDFFRLRFTAFTRNHLLQSAALALKTGLDEKIVLACLLHDIANGALIRTDHGYWGAQLIEPYVSEEISWAVRYHQALRFFPDESVGYGYPQAYREFFGPEYQPSAYVQQAYEEARNHRWYMTARLITLNDAYAFDPNVTIDPDEFTDVIGRHFKQPAAGLGFDGSPVAHMWRTMIWPNNLL